MAVITGRSSAAILALIALASAAYGQKRDHVWRTWDILEPDNCAAMWLIKRYVDPRAIFVFAPKGTPLTGNSFDVPDSKFRHYATTSTYESILQEFHINDAAAVRLGSPIHEIEISPWAVKEDTPAFAIQSRIRELIAENEDKQKVVTNVLKYFDQLHVDLRKEVHEHAAR